MFPVCDEKNRRKENGSEETGAGVSLQGSTLRSDDGANKNLYGKELSAKEIVREGKVKTTTAVQPLIALLQKISPRHANA